MCRSGFLQISALTSIPLWPILYLSRLARSGWHRERRSGRGFPNRFFMPLVMNHAATMDKARPSKPVCISQSLRIQISDFGVPRGTVTPGTKTRQTTTMMAAGTTMPTTTNSQTGTVSFSVYGKLHGGSGCYQDADQRGRERGGKECQTYAMFGSSSEKGRLLGSMSPRT